MALKTKKPIGDVMSEVKKLFSFVLVLFICPSVFGSTVKESLTSGKIGLVSIKDGYTEF